MVTEGWDWIGLQVTIPSVGKERRRPGLQASLTIRASTHRGRVGRRIRVPGLTKRSIASPFCEPLTDMQITGPVAPCVPPPLRFEFSISRPCCHFVPSCHATNGRVPVPPSAQPAAVPRRPRVPCRVRFSRTKGRPSGASRAAARPQARGVPARFSTPPGDRRHRSCQQNDRTLDQQSLRPGRDQFARVAVRPAHPRIVQSSGPFWLVWASSWRWSDWPRPTSRPAANLLRSAEPGWPQPAATSSPGQVNSKEHRECGSCTHNGSGSGSGLAGAGVASFSAFRRLFCTDDAPNPLLSISRKLQGRPAAGATKPTPLQPVESAEFSVTEEQHVNAARRVVSHRASLVQGVRECSGACR